MSGKKSIAFVSEKNACRSIIAQAYGLKLSGDNLDVNSFGLHPDRVHYLVKEVLQEKGFDMTFFFSKAYEVVERQKFDVIVSMHPAISSRLPRIPYEYQLVEWNYEDPTTQQIPEEDLKKEIEELCQSIERDVRQLLKSIE